MISPQNHFENKLNLLVVECDSSWLLTEPGSGHDPGHVLPTTYCQMYCLEVHFADERTFGSKAKPEGLALLTPKFLIDCEPWPVPSSPCSYNLLINLYFQLYLYLSLPPELVSFTFLFTTFSIDPFELYLPVCMSVFQVNISLGIFLQEILMHILASPF